MNSRFSLGVVLGAFSCLGAAGEQAQKPKVVVTDFAGNGGATARAEVTRGFRDQVTFEKGEAAKKVLSSRRLEYQQQLASFAAAGHDFLKMVKDVVTDERYRRIE